MSREWEIEVEVDSDAAKQAARRLEEGLLWFCSGAVVRGRRSDTGVAVIVEIAPGEPGAAVGASRVTFEGDHLTADDLNAPLASFVASGVPGSTFFRDDEGQVVSLASATEEQWRQFQSRVMPTRKNWKGSRLTDKQLREVAVAYQALVEQGSRKPTQAIADATDTPRSTVARWVGEARKRGLLPPAEKGVARA